MIDKYITRWMSRCILNIVPYDVKLIFRKCEKSNKKYIDLVMHREFNKICLKENLLPNYSDFRDMVDQNGPLAADDGRWKFLPPCGRPWPRSYAGRLYKEVRHSDFQSMLARSKSHIWVSPSGLPCRGSSRRQSVPCVDSDHPRKNRKNFRQQKKTKKIFSQQKNEKIFQLAAMNSLGHPRP